MVPVVISNFSLKMFSKQHRSSKSVIDTKSSPCTITTISRPSCPNVRVTPRGTRNPQWHDKSVWHVCQCLAADLVPYIDTEGSPDMPSSSGPLSSSQSATLTTCGAAHGVCLVLLVCVNAPDLDRHLLRHLLALLDCSRKPASSVPFLCFPCLSKPSWVQLAVVHVVPSELVLVFWFVAPVGAFADLFCVLLLQVRVDDLAHEQLPVITAHLCLHAFVRCRFDCSRCFTLHCTKWELAFCLSP